MLNQDSVVADMLILKLLLPSRFGKSESHFPGGWQGYGYPS